MDSLERTAVLVDDHPAWLDALEAILASARVRVVGKAGAAEEALALLEKTEAAVLIADLQLGPGASGADLIREATKRRPGLHTVVVSGYDDAVSIEEALSSGAEAFVSKAAHPEDIAAAVRQVFERSFFVVPSPLPVQRNGARSNGVRGLTRREGDILALVAEGHSNSQVARMAWITEQTVKFHLSNIYRKLGVSNRTEATHWALTHWVRDAGQDRDSANAAG
jgi:two-component system response regulator DevR